MSFVETTVEPLKARRLYLLLRDRIGGGQFGPGDRLPSEPSLAAEHKVSRVTVRRALDQLQAEGLIRRLAGIGTFVSDRRIIQPLKANLVDVLANLIEMGRNTGVRLLSFSYGDAPAEIASALQLEPGEQIQRSVRIRLVDGAPFSYLTTHVPKRIGMKYSEADLAATPLLELLERSGVIAEGARQTITATLAGPDVAQDLGVEIGSPLISLTRVVYDREEKGIEHLHALYRPDRYVLQMDLFRAVDGGRRVWRTSPPTSRRSGEERVEMS
jgi:GntR family transcriptional regulator